MVMAEYESLSSLFSQEKKYSLVLWMILLFKMAVDMFFSR